MKPGTANNPSNKKLALYFASMNQIMLFHSVKIMAASKSIVPVLKNENI